jgi:hypothetical protein
LGRALLLLESDVWKKKEKKKRSQVRPPARESIKTIYWGNFFLFLVQKVKEIIKLKAGGELLKEVWPSVTKLY